MTKPIGHLVPLATAGALGAIAALHVAWGLGSSFPFSDRQQLADTVVGSDTVPGRRQSFAVAGLLGDHHRPRGRPRAAHAPDAAPRPHRGVARPGDSRRVRVRRRNGTLGPWSNSARFVAADRRIYSPLCLALADGNRCSRRRGPSDLRGPDDRGPAQDVGCRSFDELAAGDLEPHQAGGAGGQGFDQPVAELDQVTLECGTDVVAAVPRRHGRQPGQHPGQRCLGETLHVAAVHEAPPDRPPASHRGVRRPG